VYALIAPIVCKKQPFFLRKSHFFYEKLQYVRNSLRNKYVYEDLKLHNNQEKNKTNLNKMTKKMSPETYENDVFQNKTTYKKNRIQYTYNNKTKQKKLRGHTELLMLPKNKSSNCSLLIHFFYYKKKKEKKTLLRFTFIPVYNVDVL